MNAEEKAKLLHAWRRGMIELPRRGDRAVGEVLRKILPKLGLEQQVRQSQIVEDWEKIVGATVARHARPVALRDGLLTIAVDNSMWLSELSRYQKPLLLRKVRQHLGAATVKDILFRVG